MQLVTNNPYHVLGLLSDSPQRVIERQKGKINAFQRVGKDIEFTDDILAIGFPDRNNGSIEKAFSQIEINQNKVFHSLFWFVNLSHLDETALGYLRTGDIDKSLDIWEKVTNGKSVNDKNFGAFNNLGTLKLFSAIQNDSFDTESFLEAVRLKTELIKSESFNQFCHTVADETYSTDDEKELLRIISGILEDIKSNGLQSPKNLLAQISQIDPSIKNLLSEKVSDEPFHNIETILDQTKKKRTQNPESGFSLARKLYTSTKDDFGILADILGKSDPKYKLIADKLAKEILQCGIDYFQQYRDDDEEHNGDLGNDIMKLFKYANSIAVGVQTMERIEQNIEGLQEWIDDAHVRKIQKKIESDLVFITTKLDQFENTADTVQNAELLVDSCKPKLQSIKTTLGADNETYLSLSSAVVSNTLGMIINVVNKGPSGIGPISHPSQLLEMSDTVRKASDVMDSISRFDMFPELKEHFRRNRSSLDGISAQIVKELIAFQDHVNRSTKSSNNNGCYIATMAYGSYEHPQVIELRKFRDSVLSESAFGRRFISIYYKYSPSLVELLKDKPNINSVIKSLLNLFIRIIK